jgi:hypothetical protein
MSDQALFDELQQTLSTRGPSAAIDRLCDQLQESKDYTRLFYALLMKSRHDLGVLPIPTAPASDLPRSVHEPFEEAIRAAARRVGQLYLDQGDIPQAWPYFRMIGEPAPVVAALGSHRPAEGEDVHPLVQVAFYEGVHPQKGFDLVIERFGICNAITTMGSQHELQHPPEVRQYCIKRLVRALYQELLERLRVDIERNEKVRLTTDRLPELLAGRDWLFSDEFAHIDTSHLASVVQMSIHLEPCEELQRARELCAYGLRLAPRLQYAGEPPFENQYRDYGIYLAILAGDQVEEGLAHFRAQVENADPETVGSFPAQVLVNLLLRLDRPREALDVARRHLADVQNQRLSCPSITELCQRVRDYRTLAEVAREQGDPVHFVAGLLAANGK